MTSTSTYTSTGITTYSLPPSPSSSRPSRPTRPSDTFHPRGRLPLDPFTAPAHPHHHHHQAYGAYGAGSAHASGSTSSSSASAPARSQTFPTPNQPPNLHAQRRGSTSSTASGAYEYNYGAMEQGPVWRVPRALVYGYGYEESSLPRQGRKGQVVLVLGDPAATELLPLLASPHLADPMSSLVLLATSTPPGFLHLHHQYSASTHTQVEGPGPGPGPTIRVLRLAEPLDAHDGGALRLVGLFERAGRVVDAWRAVVSGYAPAASMKEKERRRDLMAGIGFERIMLLAEDAQGEFASVQAYRPMAAPATPRSAGSASGKTGQSSPPPPAVSEDHEKERKKRFRFSLGASSLSGGSDSPRPLMESRMPSSPVLSPLTPSSPSSTLSKKSPKSAPVSPYASRRLSQSSFSLSSTAAAPWLPDRADGRTFDAIINFLPVHAPDKALLKHAILVSTLGAQYLGVGGDQSASYPGAISLGSATANGSHSATVSPTEERKPNEGGGKLRKRPSRRMSMTQRLSGFFGLGGSSGGDDKVLKELRDLAENQEKEKEMEKERLKQQQMTSAVPLLHAHVVHILPPNMGNMQERPYRHKLVQSIEQFLLNFAYPLGSMLGGGYGSMTSLGSLGGAGMQLNNIDGHSALSSMASSRNSSSSSLSALGTVQHPNAYAQASADSSQTLSQSQSAGQPHPRSRSLFSIGSTQRNSKPTTPPSAYPASNMQRQRVRSTGASPHRPTSMYNPSTFGSVNTNAIGANGTGMLSGSGSLAQLAAQMAGRPVPYLVAPGVFGAPISAVGSAGARAGARRMSYGEAMLLGVLDWDAGVAGGIGAGVGGAGRAYVAWGDVVCDGEFEGDDTVDGEGVGPTGYPPKLESVPTLKKLTIETTPRPAPTTTQLPTPPESSESSSEGCGAENEPASVAERRHNLDETPRSNSAPRFSRSPSSGCSTGSSAESPVLVSPILKPGSMTSTFNDPSVGTADPAARLVTGTEANGQSAAGVITGVEANEAIIIGESLPVASNNQPSSITPSLSLSAHERRKNHRPAPPPPSTPSPLIASMVVGTQSSEKQPKTQAPPDMVRDDQLRMSVCDAPAIRPTLVNAEGGVEMSRRNDQSQSQEGEAPFFSAVSSVPTAEPPMMITLTSATAASINRSHPQSAAVPPPITTNSSDSGYGSAESGKAHATPLSHKAARPLLVSTTANPDLPEETQKAVQDAVAKLVSETGTKSPADGRLSRRRSSKGKKGSQRSQSRARHSPSLKAASPVVAQLPGQQSSADNVKAAKKDLSTEVAKNGKLQGAWRKLGSWRRNGGSIPAEDAGSNP